MGGPIWARLILADEHFLGRMNFLLIPLLLDMAFIVGAMALSDVQRLDLGSDDEAEAMQSVVSWNPVLLYIQSIHKNWSFSG